LDHPLSIFLLDVREPDEFSDWRIDGAVNIPLGQVVDRRNELPTDQRIVVMCAKGARATRAAEALAEHGISTEVFDGGMAAWGSTYESVERDFGAATVIQIRRRGKGCLSYVVGAGDRCVVFDPSIDEEEYLSAARRHGWNIVAVADTHLHADHVSGARSLADTTGATLLLNPHDPFAFAFTPVTDGGEIVLTDEISVRVSAVSAPGHTEGSTVYRLGDDVLFTGDTLFLESVGRPDLAEQAQEFAHSLWRSLHERILPLPDSMHVLPAHYGDAVEVRHGELVTARLGDLRQTLPALALGEDEFVKWAVAHVKDRPPNYRDIVTINTGESFTREQVAGLELGPNRCAVAN
jgi:glyoxylase-like metal-dependent hydrolase (beta-lactamase superfamily II)/rhodanese-related sulfurtransferase